MSAQHTPDAAAENGDLIAIMQAVSAAIQEAIDAAKETRGAPHAFGRTTPDWDDGFLNGVQCCATIVQAAMHRTHRAAISKADGSTS